MGILEYGFRHLGNFLLSPFRKWEPPAHYRKVNAVSLTIIRDNLSSFDDSAVEMALTIAAERFKEFGLEFYVKHVENISFPKSIKRSLVEEWKSQISRGSSRSDITLLFTNRDYIRPDSDSNFAGLWIRKGNWILIDPVRYNSVPRLARTIQHEIGHSFGAVHVDDVSSVMFETTNGGDEWDTTNCRIIHENRNMHRRNHRRSRPS